MASSSTCGKSHLLGLPSELRSKIYDYVFDDIETDIYPYAYKDRSRPSLAILQACHQARSEASPILKTVLSQTTINLNSNLIDRGGPSPLLLNQYGALFNEASLPSSSPDRLLRVLDMLPNLKKLTIDYGLRFFFHRRLYCIRPLDNWLHDDCDKAYLEALALVSYGGRGGTAEWRRRTRKVRGEAAPSYQVEALLEIYVDDPEVRGLVSFLQIMS
jgi:hypothetical protein